MVVRMSVVVTPARSVVASHLLNKSRTPQYSKSSEKHHCSVDIRRRCSTKRLGRLGSCELLP